MSWAAINQAMGHYLNGCADVAMTRTPRQVLTALRKAQTGLLSHSADTLAEVTRLWRKQNAELFVMRAEPAPTPGNGRRPTRASVGWG